MRDRSLTTRLTLSHVLVTLAGLLLLSVAFLLLVNRNQRQQTIANLTAQGQVYATYAAQLAPDTNTLGAIAPDLVRRFGIASTTTLRVFGPNGTILFASQNLGAFPSSATRVLLPNPLPIQPTAPERDRRFVAVPIVRGAQVIGLIELSQSVQSEGALLRQLAWRLALASVIALVGAALAGFVLAKGLVQPLHRLGRVAAAIAGGDPAIRSDDRSADEIGQLAQQLNHMANELQARLDDVERLAGAREQFFRAISHELRTPLTAIRGTAENLEDDATPEQQEALAIIQTEALRLQRLVDELLNPQATAPVPLRRRQPIDIGALLDETRRIMQPRAERVGIDLSVKAAQDLRISGDHDRLKQALLNMLDNALTWTPAGGRVMVEAAQHSSDVCIVVRDTGPGINPDLRDRVWERGVSGNGGQGLGLALVHDVITAHGGSVHITSGAGTTIEIRLPLQQVARTM